MPGFMDLAKEGFQMYQAAQQKHSQDPTPQPNQGGDDYQSQPDYGAQPQQQQQPQQGGGYAQEYYNQSSGGNQGYSGGSGGQQQPQGGRQQYGGNGGLTTGNEIYNHPAGNIDHEQAIKTATQHAGGAQDSGMFAAALQHASAPGTTHSLDHQSVEDAHDQAYQRGNAGSLDAHSMGSAAAMQAFQMFSGKVGGGGPAAASGGGAGSSQTELISMAMSEAAKLFDKSGGAASGGKQDAVNGAAKTVMKLILQSKMGAGGAAGGGNGGGLGSLLDMASKFM